MTFPRGLLVCMAAWLAGAGLVSAQPQPTQPLADTGSPLPFRAGFPAYAFSGMEPVFAYESAAAYMSQLTRGLGITYSSRIYSDRMSLQNDVAEQKLDFVMVSSMDFLRGDLVPDFLPVLAPQYCGEVGQKFLLLVHEHSGIQTLADLANRHLLIFSDSDAGLEDAWLQRELNRSNLPAARDFFRVIDRPSSAPRTILPVFFRRADACLVSAGLLKAVASTNQQVRQRLVPLARSEPFLTTLLCVRKDFPAPARTLLITAAEQISRTPDTRRLITQARVNRVTRFEEPMLASVRTLLLDLSGYTNPEASGSFTGSRGMDRPALWPPAGEQAAVSPPDPGPPGISAPANAE